MLFHTVLISKPAETGFESLLKPFEESYSTTSLNYQMGESPEEYSTTYSTPPDHLGVIVHSPEICNNQAKIIFNVLHLANTHRLRNAQAFTFTHKTVAEAPLRLRHTQINLWRIMQCTASSYLCECSGLAAHPWGQIGCRSSGRNLVCMERWSEHFRDSPEKDRHYWL